VLSHLKHFGIGTVLDDFGTGSTSLVGLKQFPVDALKIDRSLIREMQTDRSASDIVELIILLAHKMNLKVIAEGIETLRQLERLSRTGMRVRTRIFLLAADGSQGGIDLHAAAASGEKEREHELTDCSS